MFRLTTIRRRLLLCAGSLLVLSGLSLIVAQTSLVRRFVLIQAQIRLGNALGVVIHAKELDYNFFLSRFDLKEITLRGVNLPDMPVPVRAQRIRLAIPIWQLVSGSLNRAQIDIRGLSVQWITRRDGVSNWPAIAGRANGGSSGGPSVLIQDGELYAEDERSGLVLRLPLQRLTGRSDPAAGRYAIIAESAAGWLRSEGFALPLDKLHVKAAIVNGDTFVESLHLAAGSSEANITGWLRGAPARVDASGDVNLDLRDVSHARGRIQAHLSAQGLLDALQLTASVNSTGVAMGAIKLRRPSVDALFHAATGELQLHNVSAGLLGGQLSGNATLWTGPNRRRSELMATLQGVDMRPVVSQFPGGRATLRVNASCPGLEWRLASASGMVQSRNAKGTFAASGHRGSVRTAFDLSSGGDATMHGDVGFGWTGRTLTGNLQGRIGSLAQLGALPDVDGSAEWSATLAGTVSTPALSLQLNATGLSSGQWTGADLKLQANYAANRIGIEHAQLTWAGQQIEANGEIGGTSADAPLSLEGTVKGTLPHTTAALSGEFHASGTMAHPIAQTRIQTRAFTVYGQTFSQASLDAHWGEGELTLTRLAAEQDHGTGTPGRVEAKGSLEVATGRYSLEAAGRDLRPSDVVLAGSQALAGRLQFDVRGDGDLRDPAFSAQLQAQEVSIGETALGELQGKVSAAAGRAAAILEIPALNAKLSSAISMQGTWPFESHLEMHDTHLQTTLASSFSASLHATGALAPLRIGSATTSVENFRLATPQQEILGNGPILLTYADGCIGVRRLELKSGASSLSLRGELPLSEGTREGALILKSTVDLPVLSPLLPKGSLIKGSAELDATITGTAQNPRPAGSVLLHDAGLRLPTIPQSIENLNGRVEIVDEVLRVQEVTGKAGNAPLHIKGSLPLHLISPDVPFPKIDAAQPARLSAEIERLQLSGGSGDQTASVTIAARMDAEASALDVASIRGTVELTEFQAAAKNSLLQQTGPTRISIAGGVATLEHLKIDGAGASIAAGGTLGLTGSFPLHLQAAGKTDLAFLSAVAAPLETSGTVQLDVRVGGTLNAPKTTGSIELNGATLTLPDPPVQASNIKLYADLNDEHLTVKQLSGNLNGGTFAGGGDLRVGSTGLRDTNLFLKGKDIFTQYPFGIKTVSSLDLTLASREDRLVLGGQIDVQEGYYESALDLFSGPKGSLNLGSQGLLDHRSNPILLDIRMATRRPVEVDNNLGRLSATANLRLAGDTQSPGLIGALQLEQDGRLYFGDRTYYIENGAVTFADESRITPTLNIQAYTRTGDYTIRLGIGGTPDELTTTFTSDPPLSRDDVIAVLLTGKTVAENRGVDLRALQATSLATGAMNASLSSQLRKSVGVSRVSIQPSAIAAESNPGARITITQDFTSSLRMLYSMNLSDSNDQIWVGEYDLSRRFTTRAVKQSDNTYRGEFRHDIRFGSSSQSAVPVAAVPANHRISGVRFTGADTFAPEALAKVFKVKPGQRYKSIKVRKGAERLARFFKKKGYLESRVRLDRVENGQNVGLTVRIELGPIVQLAFQGAKVSKRQQSRLRNVWHAGMSDQQRPKVSKEAILGYFATHGYPQAQVDVHVAAEAGRKTVGFDLRSGPRYRAIKIAVEGAGPGRAREILKLVQHRPMRLAVYRNPGAVVEAITRYYQQRGFLAAKVALPVQTLDAQRRSGRIVIPIVEGPEFHVGALQFSGNQALPAEHLQTGIPLAAGMVFEPARIEPAVTALKLKYGKLGYRDAVIQYAIERRDDRASVEISFTVVENRQTSVGTVSVEGNRHTSTRFALRQVKVHEGQPANTELIRESVKNLAQTGAYSSADIKVGPPAPSGASDKPVQVADLVVAVSEPKPFRLLYGGLYDSGNGPGFIADFQSHNLVGSGRVLGVRTRYDSETNEARLYITQPTWRSRRLSTTLATYFTRETQYLQTIPTQTLGISIQQDLQLRSKFLLSYGYRYERQRGFVPDPAAPNIPVSIVAVAPLSLTLSRDSRDSFLDATRGSFISHGFEVAPGFLGSNYPYARYYVQYFKYFPLTRPHPVPFGEKEQRSHLVFATGSRVGLQKGFNSVGAVLTDRFYAGGGTTVRGFHQDDLGPKLANGQPAGGNAVLVLNEELRYPLFWIFDAVTFVDVGNVFPRVSDFRFSQLRSAGGFGLRIRNPFIVLRFDYGFKFGRRPGETMGAFFFSIGQAF